MNCLIGSIAPISLSQEEGLRDGSTVHETKEKIFYSEYQPRINSS
jgi:hypothetical protein